MNSVENKQDYRVTVVIPAYNIGPYIARAIESVLSQKRPADEIIVVDDGSTDNTAEVVKKFIPMIRYIYQTNAGAAAARNTAIKAAQYDWIAFLDGDDEWLPEYLEKQIALLSRNRHLVWTTGNYLKCVCDENRQLQKLDPNQAKILLAGKEFFPEYFQAYIQDATGCTDNIVVKKQILEEAGMFREGQLMANDLDMWWRIAYRWPNIGYNTEALAYYHLHVPNSITKKYTDPKLLSDLIARHLQLAAEHGRGEQFTPCAQHMLHYWIYRYMFDERILGVRDMVVRFDKILPSYYKSFLRLLTISPQTTSFSSPTVHSPEDFRLIASSFVQSVVTCSGHGSNCKQR